MCSVQQKQALGWLISCHLQSLILCLWGHNIATCRYLFILSMASRNYCYLQIIYWDTDCTHFSSHFSSLFSHTMWLTLTANNQELCLPHQSLQQNTGKQSQQRVPYKHRYGRGTIMTITDIMLHPRIQTLTWSHNTSTFVHSREPQGSFEQEILASSRYNMDLSRIQHSIDTAVLPFLSNQ